MSKIYDSLSDKIKKVRILNGYTQTELGNVLGLPKQSVSRIEKGRRKVSSEELEKLSHFFHIPVIFLVDDKFIDKLERDQYKPENKWGIEIPPFIDDIIVTLEDYFDNLIDEGYGNKRMYIKSIENIIKVFKLFLKEYKGQIK